MSICSPHLVNIFLFPIAVPGHFIPNIFLKPISSLLWTCIFLSVPWTNNGEILHLEASVLNNILMWERQTQERDHKKVICINSSLERQWIKSYALPKNPPLNVYLHSFSKLSYPINKFKGETSVFNDNQFKKSQVCSAGNRPNSKVQKGTVSNGGD